MFERIHNTDSISIVKSYVNYPQNKYRDDKPHGLWYGFKNSWIDFCKEEMAHRVKLRYFQIHINESKILRIGSMDEVRWLEDTYGIEVELLNKQKYIRGVKWGELSKRHSGIEVVNYNEMRDEDLFEFPDWLNRWSCSSGCIWDLSIIKSVNPISREAVRVN